MEFDENSGEIEDVKKIIPEAYNDIIQPVAQEVGKFIARVPKAINAALAPFDKWIMYREYSVAETKKLLEKKLENVNPDDIVTPESYVEVPALQAISYSMDSEELRNLYANLLASSMIRDKKWQVHPSYVEIIKQITPDEAKLLKVLSGNSGSYPLIDVNIVKSDRSYNVMIHNFTTLALDVCENVDNIYAYLDNLERLKIIHIPFGVKIDDDEIYRPLEEYSEIKNLIKKELSEGSKWEIEHGKFDVTDYGKGFIKTCVIGVQS